MIDRRYREIMGYSPEEAPERNRREALIEQEDRELFRQMRGYYPEEAPGTEEGDEGAEDEGAEE